MIADVSSGIPPFTLAGWTVGPQIRTIGYGDLRNYLLSMSRKRVRIASRGVEKTGVDPEKAERAEAGYIDWKKLNGQLDGKRLSFPDVIYRQVRDRPLFILHVVQIRPLEDPSLTDYSDRIPEKPIIGWSISFPPSQTPDKKVEYIINTQKFREIYGDGSEDEDLDMDDA